MSSLGINVGQTGSSMLTELMVAAKGLSSVKNVSKGGGFRGSSFHAGGSNSFSNTSFLSGGLAGAVGHQFTQNAVQTVTGQKSNPISSKAFESSGQKGGDFANNVTSAVAQGIINNTGIMQGSQAASALTLLYTYYHNTARIYKLFFSFSSIKKYKSILLILAY